MKKLLSLVILLSFFFGLCSCGGNKADNDETYIRDGNKIYFGRYPQTKVEATETNGLASIEFDESTWKSYEYYIGSVQTDFMYYKDIDIDCNGICDYRGVYFSEYRPDLTGRNSSAEYSYQDDNGYEINKIYWFSYDIIEWDVLNELNGKVLIIANLILDSQEYYSRMTANRIDHNGGEGYANNYELSNIRKWLNDDFYNTAFNGFKKEVIDVTTVDNSANSTGESSNIYASNNTNDSFFLLSYKEFKKYCNDTKSQATVTEYAKSQGLYTYIYDDYSEKGNSWLRSPGYSLGFEAFRISYGGSYSEYFVSSTFYGVRPACWINL